jgi:hypothetical protein
MNRIFWIAVLFFSATAQAQTLLPFTNDGVEDWEGLECQSGSKGFWEYDDPDSKLILQIETMQHRSRVADPKGIQAARLQLEGKVPDLEMARRRGFDVPRRLDVDITDRVEILDRSVSIGSNPGVIRVGRFELSLTPMEKLLKGSFGGSIPGYHFELRVTPSRSSLSLVMQSTFGFLSDSFTARLPVYPSRDGQTGSRLGSYADPTVTCSYRRESRIDGRLP